MIEEVVSIELPVHERMVIKKNRLTPKDYAGEPVPRISIVTGIHGDELDGQYVCYEVIRRVNNNLERLKGIIDIYPDVNPLGIDTGSRGIPMFELDMNRVFPGDNNGAVAESVAAGRFAPQKEEQRRIFYHDLFGSAGQCPRVHRQILQGLPGVQRRGLQKPDPRPRCQGRGRYGHPQL